MKELSAVKFIETRSRFFAHLYELDSMDDILEVLKVHRRSYKKANHHCYAVRFEGDVTFKNDGEVGHPGQVLLELLKREGLDSHCLVVSRVFGGVKLGVGGVSRAFRTAGEAVVAEFHKIS